MGTISVLKTPSVESCLPEQSRGISGCSPVSLLAFLEAENLRLLRQVAQLRRDVTALREELQSSQQCPPRKPSLEAAPRRSNVSRTRSGGRPAPL
jgi:hypothetical protein